MRNSSKRRSVWKKAVLVGLLAVLGLLGFQARAGAASIVPVTVVTNQASQPVAFWILHSDGKQEAKQLRPGESLATSCFQTTEAVFQPKDTPVRVPLLPDSIQVFTDHTGTLDLLFLGPQYRDAVAKATVKQQSKAKEGLPVLSIPVRIYMDDGMPLREEIWKKRIQERFQQASAILEQACMVRLEIQDFSTWRSKPGSPDLPALLQDFEKQVPPEPGVLHVGFTNHPNFKGLETVEMGVARLPFQATILLREEAPQMTDIERLDVLLHEIGHFLGAIHTTDMNSIMRPVSKDRRERATSFHMAYDPLNVLAMNLWLREYRANGQKPITAIRRDTREKLRAVCHMIQNVAVQQSEAMGTPLAENPNLDRFLVMLGEAPAKNLTDEKQAVEQKNDAGDGEERTPKDATSDAGTPKPEVTETEAAKKPETASKPAPASKLKTDRKAQLEARQAAANAEMEETLKTLRAELMGDGWKTETVTEYTLPTKTTRFVLTTTLLAMRSESFQKAVWSKQLKGDAYTELVVRLAATASLEIGGKEDATSKAGRVARQAFVLALETLLETSGRLQTLPVYGKRFSALETPELRKIRRRTVVGPTIFGRSDLCQHFWVSAALATHLDSHAVEILGLEKERHDDLPGGSGFDITDLNADLAGIVFTEKVLDGTLSLEKIAQAFQFKQVIPSQIDLPKELKHPKTPDQETEMLRRLRKAAEAMYGD